MAGPLDFTGQNIEDTYQRVVQTDGTNFFDGTGSAVSIGGSQNLQQVTDQGSVTTTPITASIISASGNIIASNLSGTNTGDQNISNLAITGSDVVFNHITSSGNISASGTVVAGQISASSNIFTENLDVNSLTVSSEIKAPNLAAGQDNSVVILDADGRLKTDEIDGDVFDTGKLAKSFANFDNFPTYDGQVAVWRDNTTLRGYTPITATSDGILIATVVSASSVTASFIQILDVDKLRVNGVRIGERIGSETKLGNTADTKTIIQSPKLEVTDIRITGDITGSLDGGTF